MGETGENPERAGHLGRLAESACAEKPLKGEDTILQDDNLVLFGVFDGLGGHSNGKVASQTASRTVKDYFSAYAGSIARHNPEDYMKQAFLAAISAIDEAGSQIDDRGMATTATVVHVFEENNQKYAVYGHVGDTRLYASLKGEKPVQVTEDEGEGSMLTNVLDANSEPYSLKQFGVLGVGPGDRLMIFSDGITGDWDGEEEYTLPDMQLVKMPEERIPDEEFYEAAQAATPAESAQAFLSASRKKDDKSAIVIDIR